MADIRAIRDKIRALRARTVANGCTEAEAAQAAETAMRLMAEHDVSTEEVERPEYEEVAVTIGGRRSVIDSLWPRIARVCGCACFVSERSNGRAIVYFGLGPNPDVAAYVHEVCAGAVNRAVADFRKTPEYQRKRIARTRNELVRAFTEAMVARLAQRLEQMRFGIGWGNLLVQVDQARDALATRYDLRTMAPIKSASKSVKLMGARAAGHAAGQAVDVNMGVAGRKPTALLGSK